MVLYWPDKPYSHILLSLPDCACDLSRLSTTSFSKPTIKVDREPAINLEYCYGHQTSYAIPLHLGGDDGLVVGYHLVCACARGFEPRSPHMVTTGCKVCPGRRFPCSCTSGVGIVPLKKQLRVCEENF